MGRRQKFAVGVAVALLLGAASPAFAAGKGHAYGHAPATKPAKPPKPHPAKGPKAKQAHLNGGGTVGTTAAGTAGELSVQVKADKLRQGHFNFTATDVQVRCRAFPAGSVTITPGTPGTATFTNVPCSVTRAGVRSDATISGTFTDAGNPADTTPPTPGPDSVNLTVTPTTGAPLTISGPVTGNIKVH